MNTLEEFNILGKKEQTPYTHETGKIDQIKIRMKEIRDSLDKVKEEKEKDLLLQEQEKLELELEKIKSKN